MRERIYLSQPQICGREMEYINKAFSTNNLTLFGDNVEEFEATMSEYLDGRRTLAVSSGTAALHLALRYAGVGPGETVLCSSLTFAASCNPVKYLGGNLVFIDSDRETWNMSSEALRRALCWADEQKKTIRAAVIVDLYGRPAAYNLLLPLLKERNIAVIEDAAEAVGSFYHGKKCGTFGDYAALSFNSNKLITTGGGGMVVSEDAAAIEKMRYWSTQAKEPLPYYQHEDYGYQYRMSNILAGIGCAQVPLIQKYADRRREIYRRYQDAFMGYPVEMMPQLSDENPNCWLSVLQLKDKKHDALKLIAFLEEQNIETRMVWKPMHLQPVYRNCPYFTAAEEDISAELFQRGICLPSASVMTEQEQDFVIAKVKEFFK